MKYVTIDRTASASQCRIRHSEHPDWSWVRWESEWQKTGSDVDWCVAMSLMLEE